MTIKRTFKYYLKLNKTQKQKLDIKKEHSDLKKVHSTNLQEVAKDKLTLKDRTFKCWNCELELDRDVNSARNILNRVILENRFDQNLPLNKENYF